MEQRRIREHTVEVGGGQVERQEVLVPDLHPGELARHAHEALGTLETDRIVPPLAQRDQVAPRSAAEVEDAERALARDGVEQRVEVLRDVVVARPLPERGGARVVVRERDAHDLGERGGVEVRCAQ